MAAHNTRAAPDLSRAPAAGPSRSAAGWAGREVVALGGVAAERAQAVHLRERLDALGDGLEPEGVREADDGGDDRRLLVALGHAR